ncbi:MAG: PH domain-containing protein [Candidatus Izemoplasmataceae bacterium]
MDKPSETLHPNALKAFRVRGLVGFSVMIVLSITLLIISIIESEFPVWLSFSGFGLSLLIFMINVIIMPHLKMKYWGYEIKENEIDIQHGIIIVKRILIPMNRVQHVDLSYGPILKKFKLASILITTAGSNHEIPALDFETARKVHQTISHLVNLSEDDV